MTLAYANNKIRMELAESAGGECVLDDAREVIKNLQENGFQPGAAAGYVNDNILGFLSEFISGGIVSRTVREIGSDPEYFASQERIQSGNTETTFTLTKKLSVDVGKLYPYVEVSIKAGPIEVNNLRFHFKMSGKVTVENPRITVYRRKVVRATLGTVTPSFSLYYVSGGKETLIHTFRKPLVFQEIELKGTEPPEGDRQPAPPVAPA